MTALKELPGFNEHGDLPAGIYTVSLEIILARFSGAHLVFDHAAAQNLLGASVFWVRKAAALGGEEATIAHWQIKRDGGKRGIVEVTKL